MRLFGKRSGGDWTRKDAERVTQLAKSCFEADGYPVCVHGGKLLVQLTETRQMQAALANLHDVCRNAPPEEWPALVHEHFEKALAGHRAAVEIQSRIHDFSAVRDRLGLQLYDEAHAESPAPCVMARHLPGLVTMLVLDVPDNLLRVQVSQAQRWGQPGSELFKLALSQTRQRSKPNVHTQQVAADTSVTVIEDDEYAACWSLFPQATPQFRSEHGCLLAVPSRVCMAGHAVTGPSALNALMALGAMAEEVASNTPWPLSRSVFWCHDGRYDEIRQTAGGIAGLDGLMSRVGQLA